MHCPTGPRRIDVRHLIGMFPLSGLEERVLESLLRTVSIRGNIPTYRHLPFLLGPFSEGNLSRWPTRWCPRSWTLWRTTSLKTPGRWSCQRSPVLCPNESQWLPGSFSLFTSFRVAVDSANVQSSERWLLHGMAGYRQHLGEPWRFLWASRP